MGIYIKNMELPKNCDECRFAIDGFCYACPGVNVFALEKMIRPEWCPIVPVPPHGRLIDADALHYTRIRIAHEGGIIGGYNAVVMSAEIKDAPTIIPASEEGER